MRLALVITLVCSSLSSCSCERPDVASLGIVDDAVIAHRGFSAVLPEHTALAHRAAKELGVDYLELDVQRTRDGTLVVFHDDTLARTTDVAARFPGRENDPLGTFTFNELRTLDVGSWFADAQPHLARPSMRGARLLTLDDAIDIAQSPGPTVRLYLETKDPSLYPEIEREIVDALAARDMLAGAVVQSFDADSLVRFRELAPETPRLFLFGSDEYNAQGIDALVQTAVDVDAGVGPVGYNAWAWDVSAMHDQGRFVHPWVINEGWQLSLVTSMGADGVFTDRADRALRHYGRLTGDVEGDVNRLLDAIAGAPE